MRGRHAWRRPERSGQQTGAAVEVPQTRRKWFLTADESKLRMAILDIWRVAI